jgi:hypothetical protein
MAPDVYEFRVAGLIGPVLRSALPELVAIAAAPSTTLTGRTSTPDALDDILRRLRNQGLTTTFILITRHDRWNRHGHPRVRAERPSPEEWKAPPDPLTGPL